MSAPAGLSPSRLHEANDLARPAVTSEAADLSETFARLTSLGLVILTVAFGVWTLSYQLGLLLSLSVLTTCVVAVLTTTVLIAVLWRSASEDPVEPSVWGPLPVLPPARWLPLLLVSTVVAVVLAALGLPTLAALMLMAGSMVALVLLLLRGRARSSLPACAATGIQRLTGVPAEPRLWLTAWFWALVTGFISAVYSRPDGDDAYFVNLSTWVGQEGSFALRDTMFSHNTLPALREHSPPLHSIEALIGSLAYLTGISTGTVVYVLLPPLLTAVAVLTLAYAVAVCRVPAAPAALSAAVLFLLCSGANPSSYGNFFGLRIWQGKSVFLSICVPMLVALAVRYVRGGGWPRGLLLFLCVVSAVGASNTSLLLLPVFLCGLLPAAWIYGRLRRVAGVLPGLVYVLALGMVTVLLAPAGFGSGAAFTELGNDPLTRIPGSNGLLVATALAVGLGWLGLRSYAGTAVVLGLLASFAVAVFPPVTAILSDATGATLVLWRLWWVVPVPLLVAGLAGGLATMLRSRLPAGVAVGTAVAIGAIPLLGGYWIGDPRNGASLVGPLAWKVPRQGEPKAALVERVSRPGDRVLAPWYVSRVLAAKTVQIHAVSPRTFYLDTFRTIPGVMVDKRIRLQAFADGTATPKAAEVSALLKALNVRTACLDAQSKKGVGLLESIGYVRVGEVKKLICLRN
jgi:hypothetical protein